MIGKSEKFAFEFEVNQEFIEFGVKAYNECLLRPPYDVTLFEIPKYNSKIILLLMYSADVMLVESFVKHKDHKNWSPAVTAKISPAKGEAEGVHFESLMDWSQQANLPAELRKAYEDQSLRLVFDALGYMAALESKSARASDCPEPKKLNSARAKKGKPPVFEYKIVDLVLPSQYHPSSQDGGTHASPRMHWRRGHIRNLMDGKRIPVSPCIVGASENGILLKEYRAKLGQ